MYLCIVKWWRGAKIYQTNICDGRYRLDRLGSHDGRDGCLECVKHDGPDRLDGPDRRDKHEEHDECDERDKLDKRDGQDGCDGQDGQVIHDGRLIPACKFLMHSSSLRLPKINKAIKNIFKLCIAS